MESAMLTPAAQDKLNAFQLKGLRKILQMKTTFVDRTNTNERLLAEANLQAQRNNDEDRIKLFSEAYKEQRGKSCVRLLQRRVSDPIRHTTLEPTGSIWDFPHKRVGRPKAKWIAEGLGDLWEAMKKQDAGLERAHLTFNRQ